LGNFPSPGSRHQKFHYPGFLPSGPSLNSFTSDRKEQKTCLSQQARQNANMNNYKTRCVSFLLIYPVFPNLIGCFPSRKSLQQSAKVRIIEIETCLSTLLHTIFKSSDSLEDLHPCDLPLTYLINMTTASSQRQVTTFDPLAIDPDRALLNEPQSFGSAHR
jgi:hypothetical protein